MKKLFKAFLVASILALTATSAQAWWSNGYGPNYGDSVYYTDYWSDDSLWGDGRGYGRGYGRGHSSGEGSFSFSMSARGSAHSDWNGDLSSYSNYYGHPYYYGPQPVVPMASPTPAEVEPSEK